MKTEKLPKRSQWDTKTQNNSEEKKTKTAVALAYEPNDEAPKVIASGKGALAERIIERAKEADVPVHRDGKLANTLSKLQIGDCIPQELYGVVAEVLLFVDGIEKLKGKYLQQGQDVPWVK